MPILFRPQFSLTLLLLLILISPISSFTGPERSTEFWIGLSLVVLSSFWALGFLAGAFEATKTMEFLRSGTSASTRPFPLEPLETPCPLIIPPTLLSQDLISSQSDQGGVSVRTLS